MVVFRASTQADLPNISELLISAFDAPPAAPFLEPALLRWKYWDPREDWAGPRSYVLESRGRIVAHAGIWPVEFSLNGRHFRGVHMIDWASAKDVPGGGLALVQKLAALFDFIFAIGGSDSTRKALPAYGFAEIGRTWIAARPLRPVQQALTHQSRNWKLPVRLLRNAYWSLAPRVEAARGWTASEITAEQAESRLLDSPSDAVFSPRTIGFFQYLLRCPAMRFRLYQIAREGQVQGHFVLGVSRGQARLAHLAMCDGGEEALRSAYTLADQIARRLAGANEMIIRGSEGLASKAILKAGFRCLGGAPVYLRSGKTGFTFPKDFQFQLAENDEAFLDSGEFSYLT